jgi:diadenosine tetraphosphatase ApaH/serine/threonine PP2A family protein phosphatase
MKILVISDIHANLTALKTVLSEAGSVDAVWCLGDIVGYGPKPNECIQLIQEQPNMVCLLGNHDAASIDKMSVTTFNYEARLAVEWTKSKLTEENIEFLKNRPEFVILNEVTLAHGSPREPILEYLLDIRSAAENFAYFENDYCFIGHSHLPVMFTNHNGQEDVQLVFPLPDNTIQLKPRAIVNPGSVGQPRDRDPRAAFAIYDDSDYTWEYRRVDYDIKETQAAMRAAYLPERHIDRLAGGW